MRKKFGLTEDEYKKSKLGILVALLLLVTTTAVLLLEYMFGDTLMNLPIFVQGIILFGLFLMIIVLGVEIGK